MNKKVRVTIIALLGFLFIGAAAFTIPRMSSEARVARKMDQAVQSLTRNQFEEAITAYNQAIQIDPSEVLAYQGLAKIYTLQGKYDKALDIYNTGMKAVAEKDRKILSLARAGLYLDEGKLEKARQSFSEMLEADPACIDAFQGLSLVFLQQGNKEKTQEILEQAIANNPRKHQAYNILAHYLQEYGDKERALDTLIRSLEIESDQQGAYTILATIYAGNWGELVKSGSFAAEGKTSALLHFYAYYSNGDYAKALTVFEKSLDNDTGNQKAQVLAAICRQHNGQTEAAEMMVEEVIDHEPNEWIMSDIARYYLLTGDEGNAMEWAEKSFALHYNNLESVQIIAEIKKNVDRQLVDMYYNKLVLYNWQPLKTIKQYTTHQGIQVPALQLQTDPGTKADMAQRGKETSKSEALAQLNQKLCDALRKKDVSSVKTLLQQGADPNVREEETGFSALHVATLTDSQQEWEVVAELAGLLIEAGANVNGDPSHEATPLRTAAFSGNTGLIQLLLNAGADVNLDGQAVIVSAVAGVNTHETLPILLAAGADPNAANSDGTSSLMYAVQQGSSDYDLQVFHTLIQAGAELNAQNNKGDTALIYAVKSGNTQYVRALLEAGADPNMQNCYGATALMYAAFARQSTDIARLLLEGGADTAIQAAAANEDVYYRIVAGDTALSISEAHKNNAISTLLRQYGAEH